MESATESLAALRILVAVAQADGKLAAEEKDTIANALGGVDLPEGVTVDTLLSEAVDVATQAASVTTPELRDQTFRAAWAVAYADKEAHPSEVKILDFLKDTWKVEGKPGFLTNAWAGGGVLRSAIPDPTERAEAVKLEIYRYSMLSAVLGAFPIPILSVFCDVLVLGLQRRLVVGIAGYHGKVLDNKETAALLGSLIGTASLRIAVSSLVKFVPGWGIAVGATSAFATTFALGQVIARHFESGEKLSTDELKSELAAAKKEGEKEYKANKDEIAAAAKEKEAKIKDLTTQMKDGKITQEELDTQLDAL